MNRIEAMKMVGKPVYVTTALNGEYIGICKEIITPKGSPWRANVEIKAVTDYPVIGFGQGGVYKCRRPFEEGRVINVGNCSVELLKDDETIPNYEDSVGKALDVGIKTLEEHVEHDKQLGKKDRLIIKWLEVLKERKSEKEKSYFLRVVESISPDEKELLRKYEPTRRVDKEDIPSLNKLKKRTAGIIWHDGYLDEDIKPKQLVGLTIFGGWVYDALAEKEKG